MSVRAQLLRPDDLLNLEIEGINLRLDNSDPAEPALVVDNDAQPAFLVVHFPPQTITEEAFYQDSTTNPPPDEATKPYNQKPPTANLSVPDGLARARIGGASRLVFRVPADKRIPYTIEGLLDWQSLELNVSALADIPETPTSQQVSSAPAIAQPGPLETALEIPYRLILSPAHGVAWNNALGLKTHAGRTELWHTRLALRDANGLPVPTSRLNPAALRAIWSPDYNPDQFEDGDPPALGAPDADWPGVLTAMTPRDRHEIVILTSAFRGFIIGYDEYPDINYGRFLPTPIHAEQLFLSPLGAWLKSRGNWRPPMHWRFRRVVGPDIHRYFDEIVGFLNQRSSSVTDIHEHINGVGTLNAATTPENATVRVTSDVAAAPTELTTAHATAHTASEAALMRGDLLDKIGAYDLSFLGEKGQSLNISEWVHVATQGRDHYVRIVYEGVVYPTRNRAALVKVTERKIAERKDGSPVAFLAQRMFIVIRQPEVDYEPHRTADARYRHHMPLRRIRLTKLITPDIDMPVKIAGDYTFEIKVNGKPFRFGAVGHDLDEKPIDFDNALIFIPLSDLNPAVIAKVRQHYLEWDQRPCPVPGQRMTFAERKNVSAGTTDSDNTTLTTRVLHFSTDDMVNPDGSSFFRPLLFKAEVKLPAVEQILGKDVSTQIAYESTYLEHGFNAANTTGLFAHIAKESATNVLSLDKVAAKFAADQAGGISTPDLSISGLTRELGPLAGDNLDKLRTNNFDPTEFFKDVKDSAKLFGTIKLGDLLLGGTMDVGAPKVQLSTSSDKKKLTAQLHWEPQVQEADAGIVVLKPGGNTHLTIDGKVERVIADASTPTSRFEGELTDFTIELLNVVVVVFESFRFVSQSGSKPDVKIALADEPLQFKGDLEFVNELKEFIPPDLFGDGASLDVNLSRVKAGFGIGLPPLAIGVFSLQGVTLNAFIELPFLNGQPLFDFAVSSREHPFCLIVAFLGGGGFFHLQVDTEGVRMLEAALEFGASASVNLGVASGGVHIMAGIYFSMGKKDGKDYAILAGYLRMGGELSVLGLISISLEFVLSFAYVDGKAAGQATLTVKVEVAFFSKSVEITVEKRFGGSGGDPRFFEVFETPKIWKEYASAFA
jgi:hypothetical protein